MEHASAPRGASTDGPSIITGTGGGNQGVGFAIPINMARNVIEQIDDHDKVARGLLGVAIQNVNAGMAKRSA